VSYQYRAVEKFWRNFYKLSPERKESVRRAWQASNGIHFIHPSDRTRFVSYQREQNTLYSTVIESELHVIFRIDGIWVTSLDVETHKIYRQ
jgi:hypothetical protein